MKSKKFGLMLVGALLATAHPAAAYDCSQQGILDELNTYQTAQPKASGMCQSALLQIKVMKKQIEIINRCPGSDPNGDNRWQALESIKASQNTLDKMCND
jgi:hypothetical protein